MMPKEETMMDEDDYSNEDKEIQMLMNQDSRDNEQDEAEIDMSVPGPSAAKKAKIKSSNKKPSPVDEIITVSSDGFVSVNNAAANPSKSKKRKQLRHTIDEFKSAGAMMAQKQEQERLKRIEQQRNNTSLHDTYMPVQVTVPNVIKDESVIIDEPLIVKSANNEIDVIEINSDDEDDDDMQIIGVFPNRKPEVKFNGYPYRVQPPVPYGHVPPHPALQYNNQQFPPAYVYPPNNLPVNNGSLPGTSAYVDSRTRNVNKAREEEEMRLKRQKRHNKDLESVEVDTQGRLLVNFGKPDGDPDVFVASHLTNILKPHQLGGIRFMYENVIESLQAYEENPGLGCVLAHSMGLGKTLQIISFVDIFFRSVSAKLNQSLNVLIICPINVIQNWMTEFNRWLPIHDSEGNLVRSFSVFLLGDNVKSFDGRKDLILSWRKSGGVLLMGYDMYRLFLADKTNKTTENKKVLKRAAPDDNDKVQIRRALCDPGPDLIICDEGHKIKSLKTSVSNALNQVRTKRRIVLTGYPLQNNLLEYYCMVNFVRPNYLGSKKEFFAMYDRPIRNGQCLDSTPRDIKIAQQKIYLLTQTLRGFVQRRSAHLLKKILPENLEYVIILRKTPIQHSLYRAFVLYTKVEMYSAKTKYYNPLKAYSIGTKIWNHPDLLYDAYHKQRNANGNGTSAVSNGNLIANADRMRILQSNTLTDYFQIFPNTSTANSVPPKSESKPEVIDIDDADLDEIGGEISYEWAQQSLVNYELQRVENSNKFVIAFELLKQTVAKGEKMLLFSSSVLTLNLIENVLSSADLDMKDEAGVKISWRRGLSYCKFDGSTPATEREKLINRFNSSPKLHLFLISTRAGSLGINLVSANRVIIMDSSWNPCHDAQAICRIYRYGQQRKTFVYRLVMHNSMEKAIFYRQISKHGLQQKVVDELEVEAKITNKQLEDLLQYDESQDVLIKHLDPNEWKIDDEVLKNVACRYSTLIAEAPFLHESMILEAEEKLSEEEKYEAKLLLEKERQQQQNGYFPSSAPSSYGGSINISKRPDYDAMVKEYQHQSMAYKGSLRDLQGGVEYSELGLNPLQYKISNPNVQLPMQQQPQQQPLQIPLHHPLYGKSSGSLYRMNNSPLARELPRSFKSIAVIDEEIELPTADGRNGRLFKGEQVKVIRMSDRTYLKRTTGGNDIYDATNSKYNHRNVDNSVIELD